MTETETTQSKRRYPFLRALLVLIAYGGFLALLWFFPVASVRPFFQTLLRGFGYFLAGCVLFLITLLVFILSLPSGESGAATPKMTSQSDDEDDVDDEEWSSLSTGRSLLIPALTTGDKEKVWDVLYALEDDIDPTCAISVDERAGIVTVSEEDKREAAYVVQELRDRLGQAGISVKDSH